MHELQKGAAVEEEDVLSTAPDSYAQIQMIDGGMMTVRPDSKIKFDRVVFDEKEDGTEYMPLVESVEKWPQAKPPMGFVETNLFLRNRLGSPVARELFEVSTLFASGSDGIRSFFFASRGNPRNHGDDRKLS